MIKRSFIGLIDPRLDYELLEESPPDPVDIARPETAAILIDSFLDNSKPTLIQAGDQVKRGQKLTLNQGNDEYVISSVTGTVSKVAPYTGDFGQLCSYVLIDVDETESFQDDFMAHKGNPTLESAATYLRWIPGRLNLDCFTNGENPVKTIVVEGMDNSLLSTTCQQMVTTALPDLKSGMEILKKMTGAERIFLTIPSHLKHLPTKEGIDTIEIDSQYPSANPHVVVKNALGITVPENKRFEDEGVAFYPAEAVVSLSRAYETGRVPDTKTFTLVDKDGSKKVASATIGTPVHRVLKKFGIYLNEKDRIVFNGPMIGFSTFTIHHPIQSDTDSIIIQDREIIPHVSDYPCVNCGNCVRNCPANIPVNLLVRFLEAGEYEDAAANYDLFSCMECGLCSYVCLAKIPIFQYIRIGKFELNQANEASF